MDTKDVKISIQDMREAASELHKMLKRRENDLEILDQAQEKLDVLNREISWLHDCCEKRETETARAEKHINLISGITANYLSSISSSSEATINNEVKAAFRKALSNMLESLDKP